MRIIKCLLLVITTMFTSFCNAQELKKTVLGVEDVTYYSNSFTNAEASMVRDQIITAIQKTGRVIVTNHNNSTDRALRNESERRKKESAMDANAVSDMTTLNANCLLTTHLDEIDVEREIYRDIEHVKEGDKYKEVVKGEYPYYKATIIYTVTITDCATGAIRAQQTFAGEDGSYNYFDKKAEYGTPDEARAGVLKNCVYPELFRTFILNTFKAQGKILQMDEGDAKKAKTVYVNLGSEDGIAVKQRLDVYKEIDIAGEVSRKLVGELQVVEVLSGSRCLAKVKDGGDIIAQTLAIAGNLPVQTQNVK